jgi:hypothetical protein
VNETSVTAVVTTLAAESSDVLPNAAHTARSVHRVVVIVIRSPALPGMLALKKSDPPPGCVTFRVPANTSPWLPPPGFRKNSTRYDVFAPDGFTSRLKFTDSVPATTVSYADSVTG